MIGTAIHLIYHQGWYRFTGARRSLAISEEDSLIPPGTLGTEAGMPVRAGLEPVA